MEREVGGGIGMGNTCKPMAVSFQCMTKFTTNKKNNNNKKKKNRKRDTDVKKKKAIRKQLGIKQPQKSQIYKLFIFYN